MTVPIDEVRGRDVFEYILEHNPQCNLCVFYDSPIRANSPKEPSNYKDLPIHFFTCDRQIAAAYDIIFTPYFYIFSPSDFSCYVNGSGAAIAQDVFFIGEEKGDRREQLGRIASVLDRTGLTHELRLVPQNRHRRLLHRRKEAGVSYMPYSEVIAHIQGSRAVLELISDGQTGITQRSYEALFLRKKLITTSTEIKQYDFYNDENIFILGERSLDELPAFLRSPFQEVPTEILEKYTLEGWLRRFVR